MVDSQYEYIRVNSESHPTPLIKIGMRKNEDLVYIEVPDFSVMDNALIRLANLIFLQNIIVHFKSSLKIILVMEVVQNCRLFNYSYDYLSMLGMIMKNREIFNKNKDSIITCVSDCNQYSPNTLDSIRSQLQRKYNWFELMDKFFIPRLVSKQSMYSQRKEVLEWVKSSQSLTFFTSKHLWNMKDMQELKSLADFLFSEIMDSFDKEQIERCLMNYYDLSLLSYENKDIKL